MSAAAGVHATGAQEDLPYRNREQITVMGVVRVVGNEPFTRVAIRTVDGFDFFVADKLDNTVRDRQGQSVTVRGRVRIERMRSADHKYEVIEYHLEDAVLTE